MASPCSVCVCVRVWVCLPPFCSEPGPPKTNCSFFLSPSLSDSEDFASPGATSHQGGRRRAHFSSLYHPKKTLRQTVAHRRLYLQPVRTETPLHQVHQCVSSERVENIQQHQRDQDFFYLSVRQHCSPPSSLISFHRLEKSRDFEFPRNQRCCVRYSALGEDFTALSLSLPLLRPRWEGLMCCDR